MKELVPVEKERKVGRPADYDPDVHLDLLHDIFSGGGSIIQFCAEANICVKTFHNWKRKHIQFRRAYNLCLPKGAAISEKRAIHEGKDLNFQAWSFIHKNRFGQLYQKIPKLKDKSIDGKFNATWSALEKGNLTAQEYNQVMSGIVSQLRAKELELKAKELELKAKEIEGQKPKVDVSGLPDWMINGFQLLKEGKAELVLKEEME
jgi:hypothetical protein